MSEEGSLMSTHAIQIRAPPHLISSIDIVDGATVPYPNDGQSSGAIISFEFKYPSNLFFDQQEAQVTYNLNFSIQIRDNDGKPIRIEKVGASHYNLDNNITELLSNPNTSRIFKPAGDYGNGEVMIELCPLDGYGNENSNNVRVVVLLGVYPSNIDVLASLFNGTSKLKSIVTGTALPYNASSPSQQKLLDLLCWTAAFGHVEAFQTYLDQIPLGLETEDAFGMTPFSCAALGGQASVVRLALQQAGSIGARRRAAKGLAPLEAAAHSRDEDIFMALLRWLKYIETPMIIGQTNTITAEIVEIPELEHAPKLNDEDFEREIHSAIRNKQTFITRKLVEFFYDSQGEHDKQKWLANKIVSAAKDGDLYLVQALRSCGAEVNCKNDRGVTPLVGAVEKKETKVAEYLILQGAKDDDHSVLIKAVEMSQHSTIRALLQAKAPMKRILKQRLQRIAGEKQDSTTLMLLELEKGTERLATHEDLYPDVDELFYATVVRFSEDQSPEFKELTVNELMQSPNESFDLDEKSSFKWFHLPANNMKWAEALISKIYYQDPPLACKILEPKRWIKRQHEGENGSSHARFMMPACHDFQEAFNDKKKSLYEKEDRHVVLFMPFLHWDDEEAMQKRSKYLAKPFPSTPHSKIAPRPAITSAAVTNAPSSSTTTPPTDTSSNEAALSDISAPRLNTTVGAPLSNVEIQNESTDEMLQREEKLIDKYLLSEIHHGKNSRHLLHVRRTLDQSLYHNLKDTKNRDADQTVRRYQNLLNADKKLDETSFTVIMVDQLWLWILLGPSGKAETVVTCFPSRDWSDVHELNSKRLDPQRTTDVLQTTKSYIQQRPDAVKTPYDLAGVIASRCSRALLDHSTDMIDFAEVYENSISYIMNEEVLLFNNFNYLMQTRTRAMEVPQPRSKAIEELQIEKELEGLKERINAAGGLQTLAKDIQDWQTRVRAMGALQSPNQPNTEASQKIDSRLAMDIVEEIEALRSGKKSIKNTKKRCEEYRKYARFTEIPDEKEMKGLREKSDNEKGRLIHLLEKFGRFFVLDITREIFLLRQIKDIQDELEMMGKVFADQKEVIEAMDRIIRAMIRPKLGPDDSKKVKTSIMESSPRRSLVSLKVEKELNDRVHSFPIQRRRSSTMKSFLFDDASSTSGDEDSFSYGPLRHLYKETQKEKDFMKQAQSMIWQFRHQKHNLPLRTIDRFAKLVKKMNERAKNTNKALTNLVDLKQKQSTMIDTRTTRLQAEESHKMSLESELQGKTLLVFTIVTIIFLPLSFIAAFFAIPVKEFGNDNTPLTLGFVSEITFPVSAATSLLIIGIGFAASKWDWLIGKIINRRPAVKQKPVDLEAAGNTSTQNSSGTKSVYM